METKVIFRKKRWEWGNGGKGVVLEDGGSTSGGDHFYVKRFNGMVNKVVTTKGLFSGVTTGADRQVY